MAKRLIFCAFTMNTVSHIYHGLWRHPRTRQLDYTDLDIWTDLAKLLERGRFDAIFLADVIGLYGDYRGGWDTYVREGLQIPSNDPSVLISALAYVTEHLGLAFTSSIVQEHPFNFARRVSTLDHLSKGRIAWNIVTNALANGSRNFGLDDLTEHDERYSWAQEYLEVAYKLWEGSWEDDALLRDVKNGIHADPAKIHKINHSGKRYRVEGPHLPAPSPQRTPLLAQAGSSTAGRDFAALHAEAQFIIAPHTAAARAQIQDVPARAVAYGRKAENVGSAGQRRASGGCQKHPAGGNCGGSEQPERDSRRCCLTSRQDHAHRWDARANRRSPAGAGGCGNDGVKLMYSTTPGTFVDFIEQVAPELQRRGLMQREYRPGGLRDKLFGAGPFLPERHVGRSYRNWDKARVKQSPRARKERDRLSMVGAAFAACSRHDRSPHFYA